MPPPYLTQPDLGSHRLTECDIEIRADNTGAYTVTLRLADHTSATTTVLLSEARLVIDHATLFATGNAELDDSLLSRQFFANPQIQQAWIQVRTVARTTMSRLRIRLHLSAGAEVLHGLPWETLRDPDSIDYGLPLALNESIYFSRYIESNSLLPVNIADSPDRRAVLAVANPAGLEQYQMVAINVEEEVIRARQALGVAQVTVVGAYSEATSHAETLPAMDVGMPEGDLPVQSGLPDERALLRAFLRDLKDACSRQQAVILFDGYEAASPALKQWLTERMVDSLFRDPATTPAQCLVVIAGKEFPLFGTGPLSKGYRDLIYARAGLSRWSVHDIEECLRAYRGPTDPETLNVLHRSVRRGLKTVHLITMIKMFADPSQ